MATLFNNDTIGPLTTVSSEYGETLEAHHKHKKWGATAVKWAGRELAAIIDRPAYNIETALDYGCGQEALKAEFVDLDWAGYDPGIPEKATKPSGKFDLVTCIDVMEHVEPEYVEVVLQEIVDYSSSVVLIDIACAYANDVFQSGPRQGEDVHISVHPPEWWLEKIHALKGIHLQEVHARGRQIRGQWRDRVSFIIEKT